MLLLRRLTSCFQVRQRQRQTDRQRDRQRDRETDRDRDRDRDIPTDGAHTLAAFATQGACSQDGASAVKLTGWVGGWVSIARCK